MKTFGRTTIYANYTEEQLLSGTQEDRDNKVLDILNNSIEIHKQNAMESAYLQNYYIATKKIKKRSNKQEKKLIIKVLKTGLGHLWIGKRLSF
jgi:hypothetical protein